MKAIDQSKHARTPGQNDLDPETDCRLLLESNPCPLFVFAKGSLRLLAVNTAMVRKYGWSRAKLLQLSAAGLLHPSERPKLRAAFRAQHDAVTAYGGEWLHRRRNGALFHAAAQVTGIDFRGRPAALVIVTDTTHRKQAETALRASEERFRAMVKASSDVVYRMSADWREMRHLVGRDFIADTHKPNRTWMQKYIHPDDKPSMMAAIRQAIRTKSVFELEHRVLRVDGSLGWTFSRAIPILDANGKIAEWFGMASDITARRAAEAAVHEERDRLSALIHSIHDEVWYADQAGRFSLVNPKGRREFRLPEKGDANVRQLARSLEVLRPDGTPRPVEESPPLRALRGETVTNQEEIIRTPATGERRHRQVSAAPVHGVDGQIVGSVSIVRDITEHKHAEMALQEKEQRYRMAVDFTYDWEYWLDPAGRFIYISPACERITGYTAAEFQARPTLNRRLVHPADRARYDTHLRHCEHGHKPGEDEWRIRHRNGGYRWMGHACQPVFNDRGHYLGTRGSNRDITDRKQAEEALHKAQAQLEQRVVERTADLRASECSLVESEARFRQMAENVREVFWLADAKFRRMLYVSPAFETVWGLPCAELYRHPRLWSEAVHPDDRGLMRAAFIHNRQDGSLLQAEYRIVRPDGTIRWIADRGSRIRDSAGRVYRIAGVARDITVRKQVELTLVRTDRALRAITACHEALLRSATEEDLYDRVCRIIVETGGYRMAWIGMAEEDVRRQVRPVAWAGKGHGYISKAKVVWSGTPRGRGPTGTAIRTGQLSVCRDMQADVRLAPWRQAARKYGYGSSVAMPLIADGRTFGALNIYASERMGFDDDEVKLLMQLANDVAFGVTALRTQASRQRLEHQVLEISEREQRRIGQDLHDGLGQRIASARLMCSAVAHHLAGTRHESARHATRVERELAQALEETRQIARGLHPVKPGPQALMSALYELASHVTRMSRIPCRFVSRKPVLVSDHAAATHLYRIAQEAVNNAIRHARPQHIRIALTRTHGGIRLRIEDDGQGLPSAAKSPSGLGVGIMRYRSSVIGAQFAMSSKPGRGTLVTCQLPVAPEPPVASRKPQGRRRHAVQNRAH